MNIWIVISIILLIIYIGINSSFFNNSNITTINTQSKENLIKSLKSKKEFNSKKIRVLIVTAHPDDETMFFTPTITTLLNKNIIPADELIINANEETYDIYLLCLSKGINCGNTRVDELMKAGPILGIPEDNIEISDLNDGDDV